MYCKHYVFQYFYTLQISLRKKQIDLNSQEYGSAQIQENR